MTMHDQLILDEVVRLTGLVQQVATAVQAQDGRLMLLEHTAYGRMVLVGLVSGFAGVVLGALIVWGCIHVA